MTGLRARHGPHHGAQKSTRTGPGSSSTSRLKLYFSCKSMLHHCVRTPHSSRLLSDAGRLVVPCPPDFPLGEMRCAILLMLVVAGPIAAEPPKPIRELPSPEAM